MPSAQPTRSRPSASRTLAALVLAGLALAARPARAEPPETWTVKPGDTCVSIARAIWGGRDGLARLHALNDLGAPPHHLAPGTVLRLREGPVAELTLVRPRVEARAPGAAEWAPAAAGLGLVARSQLTTLDRAGAEVTFADSSRLVLRENAFAIIYGPLAARPRAPDRSGRVELVQGEATVSLAFLRGESARLATPGARLSAASREVVVAVDGSTSRVSVLDGRAEVSARGRVVALAEGEGTRVEKGRPPEAARKLPGAPALAGGARRVQLAGEGQALRLAWAPVKGAARYRVEVARDERFADRVLVRELAAEGELATVLAGLEPGRLRARVRALDAIGLVGPASPPLVVDVVALRLERGAPVPGGVRGDGEVRLALEVPPEAGDLVLTVDGTPARSPLALSAPGAHTLRLAAPGGADDGALTLSAEVVAPPAPPPAPAPKPAPAPPDPTGPVLGARLALTAGRGGPVEDGPMSSHAGVEVHLGWRISPSLSLTAFGAHAPGALALPSCGLHGCRSGSASAAGFLAAVDLAPSAAASPWLAAGAGVEWLERPAGGARRSTTLLRLEAGVDGELAPGLAAGPWFGWSVGRPEQPDAGASGRSLHGWFAVGLRGTFEPARRR